MVLKPRFSGQDNQEDRAPSGMPEVQTPQSGSHQENQTLRTGRRQEEERTDDSVLK